jgi:putative ABC transport system permease protein
MSLIYGSLQLGFLYGIMVLGIYLSFRILNIPDLTAEGSFTFGLAISALLTELGHPYLGLFAGIAAGFLAGAVTGVLQTKLSIHPILAGILTMSALYSINIYVLGAPNLSLLGDATIFSDVRALLSGVDKDIVKLLVTGVAAVLCVLLLAFFFKTHFGLCIRATGDNQEMLRASSVNVDLTKTIALGISNACIGFCGALTAQYQGSADINSGAGILVVGLASVIIGEAIFGKRSVTIGLISAIAGSIIYRFIIALATKYSIFPSYFLKLVSAVIVTVALAIPAIKVAYRKCRIKKEGLKNA